MSEKQELIRKMLKMQKAPREQEALTQDYFAPEGGHPLSGFRESMQTSPRRW